MAEVKKNNFTIPSDDKGEKTVSVNGSTLQVDVKDNQTHKVANTVSHPKAKYVNAHPDDEYIFDKGGSNNNPIYCNENVFNGCIGDCVTCQVCVSSCNATCYSGCVNCHSCNSCVSCQTVCQTSGYSPYSTQNYREYYKCHNYCMTCNNAVYGCSTCYTGTYVKGEA